jgi:hypothetical protein
MEVFFITADDGLVEIREGNGTRFDGPAARIIGRGERFQNLTYRKLVRAVAGSITVGEDGTASIGPDTRSVLPERFCDITGHGIVIHHLDSSTERIVSPRIRKDGRRRRRRWPTR